MNYRDDVHQLMPDEEPYADLQAMREWMFAPFPPDVADLPPLDHDLGLPGSDHHYGLLRLVTKSGKVNDEIIYRGRVVAVVQILNEDVSISTFVGRSLVHQAIRTSEGEGPSAVTAVVYIEAD